MQSRLRATRPAGEAWLPRTSGERTQHDEVRLGHDGEIFVLRNPGDLDAFGRTSGGVASPPD